MFYDDLLVALADPRRRMRGWSKDDPKARAWLHQISMKVKQATRFNLSDPFTYMVETVSLVEPLKLAWLYQKARAPYDLMWIEWNVTPRVEAERVWRSAHGYETPLPPVQDIVSGILIERDISNSERESVYRGYYFTNEGEGGPVGWPVGLIWDPQGMEVHSFQSEIDYTLAEFLDITQTHPMNYQLGAVWLAVHSEKMVEDPTPEAPKAQRMIFNTVSKDALMYIFESSAIACAGSAGKWILDNARKINNPERRFELAKNMLEESNGDLRYLIALLGIINTQPVSIGDSGWPQSTSLAPRIVGGKTVPYLSYKTLTLSLPSERVIKRVGKANIVLIRKRRHQVRGHYRTYRDGHKVWIHPHERGDASLGYVLKNYLVESSEESKNDSV